MAARAIVPRFGARAATRLVIPTTIRAFHPALIRRDPETPGALAGTPGTADLVNATEVPVVSYSGGQRTSEQITVQKPVQPAGKDEHHSASALKREITDKLTPTMKKFTLHGKTAVITGYVSRSHLRRRLSLY